jgi:hypothetical protein
MGITAQEYRAGIPGVEASRKPFITTDKHAGHGNIEQNALCTYAIVSQHAFVATHQPPTLSLNTTLGSHNQPLSLARNPDSMHYYILITFGEQDLTYVTARMRECITK